MNEIVGPMEFANANQNSKVCKYVPILHNIVYTSYLKILQCLSYDKDFIQVFFIKVHEN